MQGMVSVIFTSGSENLIIHEVPFLDQKSVVQYQALDLLRRITFGPRSDFESEPKVCIQTL